MCRTKIDLWSSNIRSQNQNTFTIDDNSDDYSDFSDLSDITINLDEEQKEDQEPQPLATSRPSESQPAPALVSSQPPSRQPLRPIRITSNTTYENIQAGIDEVDSWRRERADRESEVLFPLPEQNQDEKEEFEEEIQEEQEQKQEQDYASLDDFNDEEL